MPAVTLAGVWITALRVVITSARYAAGEATAIQGRAPVPVRARFAVLSPVASWTAALLNKLGSGWLGRLGLV